MAIASNAALAICPLLVLDKETLSDRQIKVLEIYNHYHSVNGHKMQSIPVCKIPENLKN